MPPSDEVVADNAKRKTQNAEAHGRFSNTHCSPCRSEFETMPEAPSEFDIVQAMKLRWSPYALTPRTVELEKVQRCLDAARWAASSYNDQPWVYFVAFREQTEAFQKMLGCLAEANREWAQHAGVLMLTAIREHFAGSGDPNRVALHDLGAASAHLALQAAVEGLQAHQMAGVHLDQVRQHYAVPEGFSPQTAIAIGYVDLHPSNEAFAQRDAAPRDRKPFREFVFGNSFGQPAFE